MNRSHVVQMSVLKRSGFSRAQQLVALLVFGVVSSGVYLSVVRHQRAGDAQAPPMDLHQTLRTAASILPADLRRLDAREGDILTMSPTSVTFRSLRQSTILCGVTATTLTVRRDRFYGTPMPFDHTKDRVAILYEGHGSALADDRWVLGKITAVPRDTLCADGKTPGYAFPVTLAFGAGQTVAGIALGAPVRGYRQTTYGVFRGADGRRYIGLKDSSTTMRSVIGPLVYGNGLTLTYYDEGGAVTADPLRVRQIGVTVRAQTELPIPQLGATGVTHRMDSLTSRVALRNNPRF